MCHKISRYTLTVFCVWLCCLQHSFQLSVDTIQTSFVLKLPTDATIGFTQTVYNINESAGRVEVTVALTPPAELGGEVEVILSTVDGAAICKFISSLKHLVIHYVKLLTC